jgi:hypothetical protein
MKKVLTVLLLGMAFSMNIFCSSTATTTARTSGQELKIGDEHMGGIVFYLYKGDDGKQHGLVMSTKETQLPWQEPVSLVNASSTIDGPDNYKLMTNSPAKDWIIKNFGPEWYLPTLNELSQIWVARFALNEALEKGNHTPLSLEGYYWSSRERGERFAYFFNFGDGDPYTYSKTFKYTVRPIRAF